jgi:CHAD domain-containing protein
MGNKPEQFVLTEDTDVTSFVTSVTNHYTAVLESSSKEHFQYYDTFDWLLYQDGYVLLREGETKYALTSVKHETIESSCTIERQQPPRFWWDFPEGDVKRHLADIISVRALLPLAEAHKESQTLRILNDDEKTILRLEVSSFTEQQHNLLLNRFTVIPVKGYHNQFESFLAFASDYGIKPESNEGNLFLRALDANGRRPLDYSSKMRVKLPEDDFAKDALKKLLNELLATIKRNEPGIIDDSDTEFLHDFRVALRRTRVILSEFKHVFPKEQINYFRDSFRELGHSTNWLRDLDVYLRRQEQITGLLPPSLQDGLKRLFKSLKLKRHQAQIKIATHLQSEDYKTLMREWDVFLNETPDICAPESHIQIKDLAQEKIWRRYHKIRKAGREIDDTSTDEQYHRIRINCKKLRYLLEFFRSLFPEDDMIYLIRQLKKLQDNLGDYHDMAVQQETLLTYLHDLETEHADAIETAASVGGLISVLAEHKRDLRSKFYKHFDKFASDKSYKLFKKYFKA